VKKILLLSNVPPSAVEVGGLVIEKLCRFLPPGSLACFAIAEPYWIHRAVVSPDLAWMPLRAVPDPRRVAGGMRDRLLAPLREARAAARMAKVVAQAAAFSAEFGAEALWCHLAGETMIRVALPVAERLGIPLFSQVLDPPDLWFSFQQPGRRSRRGLRRQFARTLAASAACAAISDPMRMQYEREFGVRSVAILPGFDPGLCLPPARQIRTEGELSIGIAGTLNQLDAWHALLAALDSVGWRIAGRRVRIRVLGRSLPIHTTSPAEIEFLGWRPQGIESLRLVADTDVLYCPSWFDAENAPAARLSFPSKLAGYFAAGRPVLFHGPSYSSTVGFLADHDAGLACCSLEPGQIVAALARLAGDRELYARLAQNGRRAFEALLSIEAMRRGFAEFLGVPLDCLRPAPDVAAAAETGLDSVHGDRAAMQP